MNSVLLRVIGYGAVLTIALLPLVYISGGVDLDVYKGACLLLTVVWFVTAFWPRAGSIAHDATEAIEHGV